MNRWCVTTNTGDVKHTSIFLGEDGALAIFERHLGYAIDKLSVLASANENGHHIMLNTKGAPVEIANRLVGTCRICKKSNKPIQIIPVTEGANIKTCDTCLLAYKQGAWTAIVKSGKSKIIRKVS